MFEKEQLNEVEFEISSHENYSVEIPRSRDSEINHESYRAEKPREANATQSANKANHAAAEVIENFYINGNPMAEKETILYVKEPHKELNVTSITDATTDIVIENERNHENTNAYKQQNVSSPELEEKCEETNTSEATDTVPEAVEAFDDEANMVVKKEAFDDEKKLHRTIIEIGRAHV